MNLNKVIDLLYLVTSEANVVDLDVKNQILFNIPKYDMKIIITELSDNKVELNFVVRNEDNFGKSEAKGDKTIVDIATITPFIIDFYAEQNRINNQLIIDELGYEQYEKWLTRDLELLKNPTITSGISHLYIEDMLNNPQECKMISFKNEITGLNENVSIKYSDKAKQKIGFLQFNSIHYSVGINKNLGQTHCINHKIAVLEMDKYPFINKYYGMPKQTNEDILSLLIAKNNNKDLGNILQYIILNNNLENKEILNKNNKKI